MREKLWCKLLLVVMLLNMLLPVTGYAETSSSVTIGWAGNLTKLTAPQGKDLQTSSIQAEVWIGGVTDKPGQGASLLVELGYKHETGTEYTWKTISYYGDVGNNDTYRGRFTPDQLGKWNYTMRVSGDNGATWYDTKVESLNVVDASEIPAVTVEKVAQLTDLVGWHSVNQVTNAVYGDVLVSDITDGPGKGNAMAAQLGYKHESETDYIWVDAEYAEDAGSYDRYKASFTPDKPGQWQYAMRFSLDDRATWDNTILGPKLFKVIQAGDLDKPYHITLSWTQDPKHTQTITWKTETSITNGQVQYAKKAEEAAFPAQAQTVNAAQELFKSQQNGKAGEYSEAHVFSATLIGLEPGETYIYRVGDGANWSDTYSFTTEAEQTDQFTFFVMGDSQSGRQEEPDYAIWGETAKKAMTDYPEAKFFLNAGDIVENDTFEHWYKWFEASEGVVDKLPGMPITGNHEYYLGYDNNGQAGGFTDLFKVPANGPDRLKGTVYSFDYGNVHFAMLNSQQREANENQQQQAPTGDILEEQKAWLDKDLSMTDKPWKVVMYHKASYFSRDGRANDAEPVKQAFQPIIDKHHVDVVFTAHDHTMTRTYPINNNNFVNSTKDGTVYYIVGRTGNKNYYDTRKMVWDAYYNNMLEQPNYMAVQVDKDRLNIKMIGLDGTLYDEYAIDKAGTELPQAELPKLPIDWTGNLAQLADGFDLGQHSVTEAVYAEVNAKDSTQFKGRGVHVRAQLGYKLEGSAEYTWIDANYSEDAGNNDKYSAVFKPSKAGTWQYAMRFSGDAGESWTMTAPKSFTAVGTPVGILDEAGGLTQISNNTLINTAVNASAEVSVTGVTSGKGQGAGVKAQLGYKAAGSADYTWVDAVYAGDTDMDKKDQYKGTFAPNKIGVWTYVMRFSADEGATWSMTETKSFTAIASSSTSTPTPTPTPAPTTPATPGTKSVTPILNKETGVAESIIDQKTIDAALAAAVQEQGRKKIALTIEPVEGTTQYRQTFPTPLLSSSKEDTVIEIDTEFAKLQLPSNMFDGMNVQTDSVSISVAKVDPSRLDSKVSSQISSRPVIELHAYAGNKRIEWNNIQAPVTVSFKYAPTAEELQNKEKITVWYIDSTNVIIPVTNAIYNASTGEITFTITHFSYYAAAYAPKTFADLGAFPWAKHAIEVMASKGIVNGRSEAAFDPAAAVTRADFVKLLVAALDLKDEASGTFPDVSKEAYYYETVAIAKELGIVKGDEKGNFNPNQHITRQDVMVMTARAMRIASKLETGTQETLLAFKDGRKVSGYAGADVASLIEAGVINGADGQIHPFNTASRAEAAMILYRVYNNR